MKKTALYNIHVGLNAKITSFGGYLMPVQYSSVKKNILRFAIIWVSLMFRTWENFL